MDKIVMKAILKEAEIPVTNYVWFYAKEWDDDKNAVTTKIEHKLRYPLIVKPANLGSSVGITKASDRVALEEAIALASSFTNRILVEEIVTPLREINCSVLGEPSELEVSLCEEPVSLDDILSFKDKYFMLQGRS
jgi:D-alanine-D-alanine ligase